MKFVFLRILYSYTQQKWFSVPLITTSKRQLMMFMLDNHLKSHSGHCHTYRAVSQFPLLHIRLSLGNKLSRGLAQIKMFAQCAGNRNTFNQMLSARDTVVVCENHVIRTRLKLGFQAFKQE